MSSNLRNDGQIADDNGLMARPPAIGAWHDGDPRPDLPVEQAAPIAQCEPHGLNILRAGRRGPFGVS
jgi:hypothetical protein